MAYETLPSNAPSYQADLTAGLIARVHNNPFSPNVERVRWPGRYDEFVRKTNEAMGAVAISDETGQATDILTGSLNAFYLQHIPQRGTAISVSDGTLDSSLTNWQQGIVFFSAMPTGDEFVVTYLAQPDRYYGEYITVLEDSIHNLQRIMGAGSTKGEGLVNGAFALFSKEANIGARLPHAKALDELDEDVTIGGVTSVQVQLGNGQDHVVLAGSRLDVRGDALGSSVEMFFGRDTGDSAIFAGDVTATGDLTVLGDLNVTGAIVTGSETREVTTTVAKTRLISELESILGVSTSAKTYMGGDADVTGEFRHIGIGNKDAKFDRNIQLTDGSIRGTTHEGKIDGLNPSTVELHRRFYRSNYRHGYLMDGYQKGLLTGTSTNTGAGTLVDSSLSALTGVSSYFDGKFDDGDYYATIIAHPNAAGEVGKRIPIVSFNGSDTLELSRDLDADGPGVQFVVHHRYAEPDVVRVGTGLSVLINADAAITAVGGSYGLYKSRRSASSVLSLPDDSTVYIFMKLTENTNEIEEDEPTFFYRTHKIESDEDVLLAEVVTAGGSVSEVSNFRLNGRYDSGWTRFSDTGSGDIRALGTDWTLSHLMGSMKRLLDEQQLTIYFTEETGADKPNTGDVRRGAFNQSPFGSATGHFTLKEISYKQAVVDVPTNAEMGHTGDLWVRVVAS